MENITEHLDVLHAGLRERRSPAAVAATLLEMGVADALPENLATGLTNLGTGRRTRMHNRYETHPGLERPFESAANLFARVIEATDAPIEAPPRPDVTDPGELEAWIGHVLWELGMDASAPTTERRAPRRKPRVVKVQYPATTLDPATGLYVRTGEVESYSYELPPKAANSRARRLGHVDYRERLNSTELAEVLPGVPRKLYSSTVRAVLHLQQRTGALKRRRALEEAVQFGKARLAPEITRPMLADAPYTAAFVAYYTARMGMRTRFTSGGQARPMDRIAEALLKLAVTEERFFVLAHVLTRRSILRRLTDTELGELAGLYQGKLVTFSHTLEGAWDPKRDRARMTVRRGDDTTTWNMASRAFNQARTGLLNVYAMLEVENPQMPGKVPALIASDVNFMHTLDGDTTLPDDVRVWLELPLPWDVALGRVDCTLDDLRAACVSLDVDPEESGWTQAYRQKDLEVEQEEANLLHGIEVPEEHLDALKAAGVYSGKP